jgi:hypothetical protein
MRIVRNHDDSFAVLTIQALQEIQNLIPGFTIQVARWLIAEQQRGIRNDATRNANALLFAT